MKLIDLIQRSPQPAPWSEGDNIPWDEPGFSERMLREHLSQEHDAASRRFTRIDEHVGWIHTALLDSRPGRVLDLGCGPGLYDHRLARLGHTCLGIDYSPASIGYARETALADNLACSFLQGDLRVADYGQGYHLAMLLYGELNIFRPADAVLILAKAFSALLPGGVLLLEPHTWAAVEAAGKTPRSWYTSASGLFSEAPHLCLVENSWDAPARAATTRYYIVEAATGEVTRHAQTFQAYTDAGYFDLLASAGFQSSAYHPSQDSLADDSGQFFVLTARKPAG